MLTRFTVKGYLRKATAHTAMKETTQAEIAYKKALELDPSCKVSSFLAYGSAVGLDTCFSPITA